MVQVCASRVSNESQFTDTWKEGRHQPIPLNPPVRADGLYICRREERHEDSFVGSSYAARV